MKVYNTGYNLNIKIGSDDTRCVLKIYLYRQVPCGLFNTSTTRLKSPQMGISDSV